MIWLVLLAFLRILSHIPLLYIITQIYTILKNEIVCISLMFLNEREYSTSKLRAALQNSTKTIAFQSGCS